MPWVSTFQVKMLVFPGRLESNAIVFPSGDQLLSSLINPMILFASGSWFWLRSAGDESSNAMSRQKRYLILVSDRLRLCEATNLMQIHNVNASSRTGLGLT